MSHLLVVSIVASLLSLPLSAGESLVVFLGSTNESPGVRQYLQVELSRLLEPAGLPVNLKTPSEQRLGEDFSKLVVAKLHGNCVAEPLAGTATSLFEPRSLASTAISDGAILPFATVECDNLRRALSPALLAAKKSFREEMFGRAVGRVLAHEIYHMLVQTRQHRGEGISKSCFSLADLAAPNFAFDTVTLAQLKPTPKEIDNLEAEGESGR